MKTPALRIDPILCTLKCGRLNIRLTPRECVLLSVLAANAGRVVSRAEIRAAFFRDHAATVSASNLVDVYVSMLRRKLSAANAPLVIVARRGRGYVLHTHRAAVRLGA